MPWHHSGLVHQPLSASCPCPCNTPCWLRPSCNAAGKGGWGSRLRNSSAAAKADSSLRQLFHKRPKGTAPSLAPPTEPPFHPTSSQPAPSALPSSLSLHSSAAAPTANAPPAAPAAAPQLSPLGSGLRAQGSQATQAASSAPAAQGSGLPGSRPQPGSGRGQPAPDDFLDSLFDSLPSRAAPPHNPPTTQPAPAAQSPRAKSRVVGSETLPSQGSGQLHVDLDAAVGAGHSMPGAAQQDRGRVGGGSVGSLGSAGSGPLHAALASPVEGLIAPQGFRSPERPAPQPSQAVRVNMGCILCLQKGQ